MSNLTGFDSEAVGFDSVSQDCRPNRSSSSQTTEFSESGTGSQTNTSKNIGCMVYPEDLKEQEEVLNDYPPPGLNEFLRRVAPVMMDQLDQNDKEPQLLNDSSDSDEEEVLTAKLLQEIKLKDGSGDHQSSVLGVTWSSAGNSLAVSLGSTQHDEWCQSAGLIKVYTLKRSVDRFVHTIDVAEKNCVSVLQYHPTVAALLAYGTTSGEVVLCNLSSGCLEAGATLASPAGCHGCRRVSALHWADAPLANTLLAMQISCRGIRRGAADQVLLSAGSDGSLVAWRVNAGAQVFESIASYCVDAVRGAAADITCFDFARSSPLRPVRDKTPDVFVVGSKTGKLFLCKLQAAQCTAAAAARDPVCDAPEPHAACVLAVAFSARRPALFVSLSMDAELRVYDVAQGAPLKVSHLEAPVSCMSWVSGGVLLVGLAGCDELLRVYDPCGGRVLPVSGFRGNAGVNCIAVNQSGSCRVAAGDDSATVRLWELPARRIKLSAHDLDF